MTPAHDVTVPPPSASDYTVQAGDIVRDRDSVLGIWRDGRLGSDARMAAKYNWFYRDCPYGPPRLRLLRDERDGCAAGTCAAGRRPMWWRGRPIDASLLVDLAVLPAHRSLGPALAMQQSLIACALETSAVVYGFPNRKAAALVQRAGTTKIADMVRYVRVLRHGAYLRRRLPAPLAGLAGAAMDLALRVRDRARAGLRATLHAEWLDRADARLDALWAASDHAGALHAVRDATHARWRFDAAPSRDTRHLLLCGRGGAPRAWFCVEREGHLLHVRDAWSIDALRGMSPRSVDLLLAAARATGAHAVSIELATTAARSAPWRARGFVERERRPVFARTGDSAMIMDMATDLYMTAADEDE